MNYHVTTDKIKEIKEGEVLRKAFICSEVKAIDKEQRLIDFTISTDAVDRYGDIITVSGWDLKQYRKNPVVLFGHDSRQPPIARATKVWKDTALHATAQFMSADLSPFADSIFRMYQEKFLRAVSVGFIPLKYERMVDAEENFTGYKFVKQELLEFSAVPIPANPEALIDAKNAGIDLKPIRQWAEHVLDNWGDEGDPLKNLYGIGRREIENIQRKSSPIIKPFKVSPEMQDELLRKNLSTIKKNKEQKIEDETTEDENKVLISLAVGDGLEILLPSLESKDYEDAKSIQFSTEIVNEQKIVFSDNTPEKTVFDIEFITGEIDNDNDHLKLLDNNKVEIKVANKEMIYKLIGINTVDNGVIAELVSAKDIPVELNVEDETKVEEKIEEVEIEEAETEETEVEEVSVEEEDTSEDEIVIEDSVEKVETKSEMDFDTVITNFEGILVDFEEVLDKKLSSNTSFSRHTLRKMKFLASCMRDLAQTIDPVEEVEEPVKETDSVKDKVGTKQTNINQVETLIAERTATLQPVITAIVERTLRKIKGRLD